MVRKSERGSHFLLFFNLHWKTTLTEKTEKYKYQFIQKTNITR